MIRATWLPASLFTLSFLLGFEHWMFWVAASIFWLDFVGRAWDYDYLLSLPDKKRRMLFHIYAKTRCGRECMIAVDGDFARDYYYTLGYRWYHVLPDEALTRRSPFLKVTFWMGLATGHIRGRQQ